MVVSCVVGCTSRWGGGGGGRSLYVPYIQKEETRLFWLNVSANVGLRPTMIEFRFDPF